MHSAFDAVVVSGEKVADASRVGSSLAGGVLLLVVEGVDACDGGGDDKGGGRDGGGSEGGVGEGRMKSPSALRLRLRPAAAGTHPAYNPRYNPRVGSETPSRNSHSKKKKKTKVMYSTGSSTVLSSGLSYTFRPPSTRCGSGRPPHWLCPRISPTCSGSLLCTSLSPA